MLPVLDAAVCLYCGTPPGKERRASPIDGGPRFASCRVWRCPAVHYLLPYPLHHITTGVTQVCRETAQVTKGPRECEERLTAEQGPKAVFKWMRPAAR